MLCRGRRCPCFSFCYFETRILVIVAQLALSSSCLAFLRLGLWTCLSAWQLPLSWWFGLQWLSFWLHSSVGDKWSWEPFSVFHTDECDLMLALRNTLFHLQNKTSKCQIIKHNETYFEQKRSQMKLIFLVYYRGSNWFNINVGVQWHSWHDSDFVKMLKIDW